MYFVQSRTVLINLWCEHNLETILKPGEFSWGNPAQKSAMDKTLQLASDTYL